MDIANEHTRRDIIDEPHWSFDFKKGSETDKDDYQ